VLNPEWRWIVKKAWSFRLMAVAGVLSAAEVILPMFAQDIPRGTFALISAIVIPLSMVARVVVQRRQQ